MRSIRGDERVAMARDSHGSRPRAATRSAMGGSEWPWLRSPGTGDTARTMPQDNVEVVRRVIENLNETGEAGPLELYDPEVTFTTRGDIGGTDTFTGHVGLVRAVEMFGEAWAQTSARVIDVIEGDDVV